MGRGRWLIGMAIVVLGGVALASGLWAQAKPEQVTIGYQVIPNAEIVGKQLGWFEKEMGVKISWKQFDSGRDVNTAMASGGLDMGLVGTSPAAAGIAQGLPYEVVWIHDLEGENESLVVKKGKGIKAVGDLVGKKVATPFGSTTHYSLLGALKVFKVEPAKVKILDMQPPDIAGGGRAGDAHAGLGGRTGAAVRSLPRHVGQAREVRQGAQGHGRLPRLAEDDQVRPRPGRLREGDQSLVSREGRQVGACPSKSGATP